MDIVTTIGIVVGVPSAIVAIGVIVGWVRRHGRTDHQIEIQHSQATQEAGLTRPIPSVSENLAQPPFVVPFTQYPYFQGMESELGQLHSAIQESRRASVIPSLVGMAGVGKTQLAVEYAYRNRGHHSYGAGIFWINAAESLSTEFANLGKILNPDTFDQPDVLQIRTAFEYFLQNENALLILDNVEDPQTLNRPIVEHFVPLALPCCIILTTRRTDLDQDLFPSVPVSFLTEEEAVKLLLRIESRNPLSSRSRAEIDASREICRILGYLPLAIAIAGGQIAKGRVKSLISYRTLLVEWGALDVTDSKEGGVYDADMSTRHQAAVGATFESQWDSLQNQDSRLLLQIAGQFPEATIFPSFRLGLLAGLKEGAVDPFGSQTDVAIRELTDVSLMENLLEDRVRLHPLIRAYAAKKVPTDKAVEFRRWCVENLVSGFEDISVLANQDKQRGIDALQEDLLFGSELLTGFTHESKKPQAFTEERTDGLAARLEVIQNLLAKEAHNLRRHDSEPQETVKFVQQLHMRAVALGIGRLKYLTSEYLRSSGKSRLLLHWRTESDSDELVRTLLGHERFVNAVGVTPDGQQVLSGSSDGTLRQWDLATGAMIRVLARDLEHVKALAVTPNGGHVVSGGLDGSLMRWDLKTGDVDLTMTGHGWIVQAIAITSDGQYAVTGSSDGTLRSWDLKTGEQLRCLSSGHKFIDFLVITLDGRHVIWTSDSGALTKTEIETGTVSWTNLAHEYSFRQLSLSLDGHHLICWSHPQGVMILRVSTGEIIRSFEVPGIATAIASWGHLIFTGSDLIRLEENMFGMWDMESGELLKVFVGHEHAVSALAVSPSGQYVVSGSHDNTIKIWETHAPQKGRGPVPHPQFVRAIAATQDGRLGVSCSHDGTLKTWSVRTGEVIQIITVPKYLTAIALTGDGSKVISCTYGETPTLRDITSGECIGSLNDHNDLIRSITVTQDGRIAVAGGNSCKVLVWNMNSGELLHSMPGHENWVNEVVVAPDGRLAISGSEDKTLKVWDIHDGSLKYTITAHRLAVTALALTPDGHTIVSGSFDRDIKLWDLTVGRLLGTLTGHTGWISALSVTPDARKIISVSNDKTLRIWDIETGDQLTAVKFDFSLNCVTVADDGCTILVGDYMGNLYKLTYFE